MGQIMKLCCLLLFAVFFSPASCESRIKKVQKSRLLMEYDWPQPNKHVNRLPHPESCQHFYIVKADGSYFMKNCPEDDIFDYRSLRCKEKSLAKCWKDIVEKGKLKKLKRNFSCPFPWGLYPDVEDCSQFFECLGGIHHIRKCPASSVFDKAERTCVPTVKALCADESDVVEPGYKCPYKWGYYPHSSDCSKYYECLRKVPNIRTCGKNLLFDNFRRNCFPMEEVDCVKRMNPYEKTTRLPTEETKIKSSSNIPALVTSGNIPTKGDDAHTSMPEIRDKETEQSKEVKVTVVPLENKDSSTKLEKVGVENLTTKHDTIPLEKATKQDALNTTLVNKILVETIATELDKAVAETATELHGNSVENNETHSDGTATKNYPSKPGKSEEQKVTTSVRAKKTSLEITTSKLDEVSEKTTRKYDKTSAENVHVTSSKASSTKNEAKDDKTVEAITAKQN